MKVSIITPLYNQAQFIAETIESALSQTYQNTEIIICNDASTDNSLVVASEYRDKYPDKIKIVGHEVNRGLPASRNTAIRASNGDLILPLDSDDRIVPKYLESTVPWMADATVGLVSTYMRICPTWDMIAHGGHSEQDTGHPGSGYHIHAPNDREILEGNCLPVCSLIRRKTLEEMGLYPEQFVRGSEDWALWAKIVTTRRWKVAIVPQYLFLYRVHKDSMCRSTVMAPFEVSKRMIRDYCNV